MYPSRERRFIVINLITIFTLFVLILAGGIVRSTGSGMGCPDWPKCFGQYLPPTDTLDLPSDYKEKFVASRVKKNEHFAKTLDLLGYGELAKRIRNDKSILLPEEFNASKTWTEYINRLIGALSGLLLLTCVILAIPYLKSRKGIFYLSLLNLVLVAFQAWLGSIVVSTNLLSWVVTVHMLIALAIVGITIYTFFRAKTLRDRKLLANQSGGITRKLAGIAVIVTLIQITFGTEVRESVDAIAFDMGHYGRSEWVEKLGFVFDLHRNLAIVVLIVSGLIFYRIRKQYSLIGEQFKFVCIVVGFITIQILTGIVLSYLALPAVAQTMHMVVATLLFGSQYYLYLLLQRNKVYKRRSAKRI